MDVCLCSGIEFDVIDRPGWHIDSTGSPDPVEIRFGQCRKCGVIRQLGLPFDTKEGHVEYYKLYPPTRPEYRAKSVQSDTELAESRYREYLIPVNAKVLDVGSGSGAFTSVCRIHGCEAFGCEIGRYHDEVAGEFVYRKPFEDIHFPTDSFDWVTCHDVLEHVLDPITFIKELYRVTKPNGRCIVDFPRFFHPTGTHHWKDMEHIWCFTEDQLCRILGDAGFVINNIKNPIESKVVIYCSKPVTKRVRILVPPGIGDSYWSIVKMQSFIKKMRIDLPDVATVSPNSDKYGGENRATPFLEMFPFIHAVKGLVVGDVNLKRIWHEAYAVAERTIFRDIGGFDFFLSYNGHLRVGESLDAIDPDLPCDWHPPMFVSLDQENYKLRCEEQFGKYIVYYFPFYGTYRYWTKEFPSFRLMSSIERITQKTECVPVFAGARWDADDPDTRKVIKGVGGVDLTGKTSVEELFGLLRGAQAVVGYPSGMTIMAAVLGLKTFILWNRYYNKDFAWLCAPPDTRAYNYFIDFTHNLIGDRLVSQVVDLIGQIWRRPVLPVASQEALLREPSVVQEALDRGEPPDIKPDGSVPVVLCVLKSGGDYTVDYVVKLRNMIARHVTKPYRFACLTDVNIPSSVCESIELKFNLKGWWSKLELFRPDLGVDADRYIYFDLDTVIISNIDDIIQLHTPFAGLGSWLPIDNRAAPEYFGSGMMLWQNNGADYSFLLNEYDPAQQPKPTTGWNTGDQRYIVESLAKHGYRHRTIQDMVNGVYSYKKNCLKQLPPDARVICFHGHPRPHQVTRLGWVRASWR